VADEQQQAWILRVLGIDLGADGAPVSILPEAPDELTVQGLALAEAAAEGAAFCEECVNPAEAEDTFTDV